MGISRRAGSDESENSDNDEWDGEGRKPLSDKDLGERAYSPVCTWCKHWAPGDARHCAGAYPRGGPSIPMSVWSGRNMHLTHIAQPDDHGVTFDLHPDVDLATLKEGNPTLYAGYLARQKAEGRSSSES